VLIKSLRQKRWAQLFVANLRIFIGLAFLPASLKKLLGQPFTDPENAGVFHEFLHAFHAVDGFYQLVGGLQLVTAILLMTQRFATLGAALALPLLVAISALCWSSAGIPTVTVVTLMTCGTMGLLLWEVDRWRSIFSAEETAVDLKIAPLPELLDRELWRKCGAAMVIVYVGVTLSQGGVYRPRGVELDNASFYLLPLILLFPIVTWGIDWTRYRRRSASTEASTSTD
jgi:uncharacterized membrane protein YphA (DoxX/SURF4 family)